MSPQTQAVLDAVLALPESERALLIERLLEDVPPEFEEVTDEALLAELDRRSAEFQRDPSVGVPWSEVRRELGD
jgi:putative addiction module component (TIGR02574 family)